MREAKENTAIALWLIIIAACVVVAVVLACLDAAYKVINEE